RPVVSQTVDRMLPNAVSHQVFEADDLVPSIRRALSGGSDSGSTAEQRGLLARHLASLDGPLAAERIADILVEIARSGALAGAVPAGRRLSGQALGRLRQLSRLVRERQPGTTSSRAYLRHKFPGIALAEVQARVHRLDQAVG